MCYPPQHPVCFANQTLLKTKGVTLSLTKKKSSGNLTGLIYAESIGCTLIGVKRTLLQ